MKGTPTSIHDLTMKASCVQHPELDDNHRHFLLLLAQFASYRTGRNVRPGYEYLMAAMGKKENTIRLYARHCESLGLIELVRKPTGKGIATEWRICLENSAYPDAYPTCKDQSLGPSVGKDQETTLGPCAGGLSPLPSAPLPLAEPTLAPCLLKDPSNTPSKETPTPPPGQNGLNVGAPSRAAIDVENDRQKVFDVFTKHEKQAPRTTKKQEREIDKFIANDGVDFVCRTLYRWVHQNEAYRTWTDKKTGKVETTQYPLAAFIRDYKREAQATRVLEAGKLTSEEIKRINERTAKLREELFSLPSKAVDEPTADDFFSTE